MVAEDFAVDLANGLPVFGMREEHAGADYVAEGRSGAGENVFGDGENLACLLCCVGIVCAHRTGAGDVDQCCQCARRGRSR